MKTFKLVDTFTQDGFYLTQSYGVNEAYYKQFGLLWHEGVDFGHKDKGVIVRSPLSGVVIRDVDIPDKAYGKFVVIWNKEQRCAVWLCHGDTNLVNDGQEIAAGDPIIEMGASGNVTGEHVHMNFVQTDDAGNRLYKAASTNQGFLDPMHPM